MDIGLEKINWEQARVRIQEVNPEFARLIDEHSPGKDLYLYRASYPFGTTIVNKGMFHLPNAQNEVVPIDDQTIAQSVQNDLSYTKSIPVSVLLGNSCELFIETDSHILPVLTAGRGAIAALWKELDIHTNYHPADLFSVTSGARCIFMLPNISNTLFHKNLRRDYNMRQSVPNTLFEHWDVFKDIVSNSDSSWHTEFILFPKKWLEIIKTDFSWQRVYNFLLESAWHSSAFERNQSFYEFAFYCALQNRNRKVNPYIVDTVKHLLAIILGAAPGFIPATDSSLAPIETIQQAYLDSYGLKNIPTLMHPSHFVYDDLNCLPVYYSLQLPTALRFSLETRNTFTLDNMRELCEMLELFLDEFRSGTIPCTDTVLGQLPERIQFNYFHHRIDRNKEVQLTDAIPEQDERFSQLNKEVQHAEGLPFANVGPFLRGCVSIGHRQEKG